MANGPGTGPSRPEVEVEVGVGGVSGVDDGTGQKDDTSQGDQTVDIDHSANAKPYPEPQSAEGAFVNDEGIDLNTDADHTSTAQGNKYGTAGDAARGFRDEAEAEAKTLIARLRELKTMYDKWDAVYQESGGDEDGEDSTENHVLKELPEDDLKPNVRER